MEEREREGERGGEGEGKRGWEGESRGCYMICDLFRQDQRLSKEEILQHQDVFVSSQATDFGDYLVRHDEF